MLIILFHFIFEKESLWQIDKTANPLTHCMSNEKKGKQVMCKNEKHPLWYLNRSVSFPVVTVITKRVRKKISP
jgi:hypothetical protein